MLYAIDSEHKCFGDMSCYVQCTQTRAPSKTCHCPCMPLSWGRGSFYIQFQPPFPCSEYFWKLFAKSQRWLNLRFMESRRLNHQRINRLKDQKIKTKQKPSILWDFCFQREPTKNKILKWFWFSHTSPDSQKKKRKILWIPIVHAKRCGFDLSLHLPLSLFFSFVHITLIKCVKGL